MVPRCSCLTALSGTYTLRHPRFQARYAQVEVLPVEGVEHGVEAAERDEHGGAKRRRRPACVRDRIGAAAVREVVVLQARVIDKPETVKRAMHALVEPASRARVAAPDGGARREDAGIVERARGAGPGIRARWPRRSSGTAPRHCGRGPPRGCSSRRTPRGAARASPPRRGQNGPRGVRGCRRCSRRRPR